MHINLFTQRTHTMHAVYQGFWGFLGFFLVFFFYHFASINSLSLQKKLLCKCYHSLITYEETEAETQCDTVLVTELKQDRLTQMLRPSQNAGSEGCSQ